MANKTVQINVKNFPLKLWIEFKILCTSNQITVLEGLECAIQYYLQRKARES